MVAEIHQHWIGRHRVIAITPAVSMSVGRTEWQPSCTLLLPRLLLLEGQPTSWLWGGALQELPWAQLSQGSGYRTVGGNRIRASALPGRLSTVLQPARATHRRINGEDAHETQVTLFSDPAVLPVLVAGGSSPRGRSAGGNADDMHTG